MEDQACPKCKTTVYSKPNMKLMVNVCGHNLCESCVELLFVKGSGSCPECAIPLRRNNFRIQLFEDASIDKEVDIRKRILRDYCKKEEDFDSSREFNDYLEMVEDIIFNLSNNIDILETNKRIAEYKEKNKDSISKSRNKLSREMLDLEDLLAEEARLGDLRLKETKREMVAEKKLKAQNKEKLIDDLMFSDGDATAIVSQHSQVAADEMASLKLPKFSTSDVAAAARSNRVIAAAAVKEVVAVPYRYEPLPHPLDGPEMPTEKMLVQRRYYDQVKRVEPSELAGGFNERISCVRALQEAMSGLFYSS